MALESGRTRPNGTTVATNGSSIYKNAEFYDFSCKVSVAVFSTLSSERWAHLSTKQVRCAAFSLVSRLVLDIVLITQMIPTGWGRW